MQDVGELVSRARAEIESSADLARLDEVRVKYLGKKGELTAQLKQLGTLSADERPAGTAIYYLLRRGERSHWHRVDAAEVWHYYAGDPLALSVAPPSCSPWSFPRMYICWPEPPFSSSVSACSK